MEAWAEHPYRDIVDNRVDFEQKVHFKNKHNPGINMQLNGKIKGQNFNGIKYAS